jgi:protein-arginine kinase activator protein McsA
MKNTFLLDQYIALMECKLTLAKLHKEKHLVIRNNQFEQAADLRAQERDTKTQIENITEDAWNYFTQHLEGRDKETERPNLYLIIDESTTCYRANQKTIQTLNPKPNLSEMNHQTEPTQTPNQTAEAFKEHFAHIFTELTALHEKLMEEERFIEAKNVLDQCMSLAVYIQTWGEESW